MTRTLITKDARQVVEVVHSGKDPGMWIVRRWEKRLLGRKLVSSCWFNDEQQALAFAGRRD